MDEQTSHTRDFFDQLFGGKPMDTCSRCGKTMPKGSMVKTGLSFARVTTCHDCLVLGEEDESEGEPSELY